MDRNEQKRVVAEYAVNAEVRSGMKLGLGSGSTSMQAVKYIGALVAAGKLTDLLCVPTSFDTMVEAQRLGIPLRDLNDPCFNGGLDLTIDGADEVDPAGNLIKGGGAALTQEKIVGYNSKRLVMIVDEAKLVPHLGATFPVPIEVMAFARAPVMRALAALGGRPELRAAVRKAGPVVTDNGNLIVDLHFDRPFDPAALEVELNKIPGVVENGVFSRLPPVVYVAYADGRTAVR